MNLKSTEANELALHHCNQLFPFFICDVYKYIVNKNLSGIDAEVILTTNMAC
jgi:hypothetical protein